MTATARAAVEPVFDISDRLTFQSFRAVFRADLDDPAVTNALMLTLLFATNEGNIDAEFLDCKSKAIQHINNKLAAPLETSIEATLGSILLLIGVEVSLPVPVRRHSLTSGSNVLLQSRLGIRSSVQIHLQGVLQLLNLCNSRQVYLKDGIKRAIFW